MKKVILIIGLILSIAVYVYAQTTWSDYDELPITEIADGDDFLVRDVSEATTVTGIQKRYLWSSLKSDLIDSLIAGDIPDLSGTYQPLDATLTTVAANTLDPVTVTQSVTTDADPYTLTPTTGKERVVILVTTHADNVDISLSETGAVHLETIYIHNLSANTLIFSDDPAVQEIAGYVELEQDNVAEFQYRTDRWVYIGIQDTLFLANLGLPFDESADATLTTAGQIHVRGDEDRVSFHAGAGGEIAGEVTKSLLDMVVVTFDPAYMYDQESTNRIVPLFTVNSKLYPNGIIIDYAAISYNKDPTTELNTFDIAYADAQIGIANPVNIVSNQTTTNGVWTEDTDANFNSGTAIPAGKFMYLHFDADPTDANVICTLTIIFHAEED